MDIRFDLLREAKVRMLSATQMTLNVLRDDYREDLTRNVVVPPLSREAKRSKEGEYPYADTFQGHDNVAAASKVVGFDVVGVAGVLDSSGGSGPYKGRSEAGGEHLLELTNQGRLGMVDTWRRGESEYEQIFATEIMQ